MSAVPDGICILPGNPVLSILLAMLTVSPQISYCGFCAPMTPATTGPWFKPERERDTQRISHKITCTWMLNGLVASTGYCFKDKDKDKTKTKTKQRQRQSKDKDEAKTKQRQRQSPR